MGLGAAARTPSHPGSGRDRANCAERVAPADTMADTSPRGRPSKLTPEIHKAIVEAIRNGASRQAAAASVRVGFSTVKEWMTRGDGAHPDREQSSDFAAFSTDVHAAEAEFEQSLVANVMAYSAMGEKPDWRGPAWLLERRFSERWGKTTRTELTGKDGGPVAVASTVDVTKLTDEQLAAIVGERRTAPEGEGGTGDPSP